MYKRQVYVRVWVRVPSLLAPMFPVWEASRGRVALSSAYRVRRTVTQSPACHWPVRGGGAGGGGIAGGAGDAGCAGGFCFIAGLRAQVEDEGGGEVGLRGASVVYQLVGLAGGEEDGQQAEEAGGEGR